ncbi:transcriptional regulator [Levilactobacillus parabrevis ATCC 53295]|uniref:Transcriptional regulator n=1 Tax=Levilactobacillus parabrevis ATCC 53295 TaxID=1267003 RepID=A0A0R1H4U9_9LACO|nr:transcriptional regulator [Levilactobacillus parabrevis ATCC 53295]KRO06664.1 transcriptional regulator [Levilactobacillus parabrevis]
MAERLEISTSYLKKIVQKLAAAKIVKTVSGRDGGIVLMKDPLKITLLDVFNAIEGTEPLVQGTGLVSKVFGLDQKAAFMETYQLEDFKDTRPVANVLAVFAQAEEKFRQQLATLSIGDVLPTTGDQPLQLDWTKWLTR